MNENLTLVEKLQYIKSWLPEDRQGMKQAIEEAILELKRHNPYEHRTNPSILVEFKNTESMIKGGVYTDVLGNIVHIEVKYKTDI